MTDEHPVPDEAWHGPAGDLLGLVSGRTEADPTAILFGFLAAYGNIVGPSPHLMIDQDRHTAKIWPISVGDTAKARKGHARNIVREVTRHLDAEWFEHRNVSGHASGEALVEDLTPDTVVDGEAPQAVDPRLFVVEGEFSRVLKVASRQGQILSDQLRNAFDGIPIHNRRAHSRKVATEHHVTVVGDITRDELVELLSQTDAVNGFGNRFVWCEVHRQGRHSRGGGITSDELRVWALTLRRALLGARHVSAMQWSIAGGDAWDDWYDQLDDHRPGTWGSLTSRDDAYALRIAITYALLDGSATLELEHIQAGTALSDWTVASAGRIFGNATGNRHADRLIAHLDVAGADGLDGRSIDRLFGGRSQIAAAARERAMQLGLAVEFHEDSGGRPRRILYGFDYAPNGAVK